MKYARRLEYLGSGPNHASFLADNGYTLTLISLEAGLFRLHWNKDGIWSMPRTWAIAWNQTDVPYEGHSRDNLLGFSRPLLQTEQIGQVVHLRGTSLEIRVHLESAHVEWFHQEKLVLRERPTDAFGADARTGELTHAHQLMSDAAFFGLGEASGPLNRRGRRFEMRNLDAMGYDAELTDPLYKHFPFLIQKRADSVVGLFYDNFATNVFNLGQEIDNYHGPYFSWKSEGGDLDLYFMVGPDVRSVTRLFTRLTGKPFVPPAWSLGFSGSTMSYTDAPDAQHQLEGFLQKLEETSLPCQSFHLSSGYTSIGKHRYVFTWNQDKIPDPSALVKKFHDAGVRFIPNIKPVLLTDHPQYGAASNAGLFIKDGDGLPELSQFWDGLGSHLDFSNSKTVVWWKKNIHEQLVSHGIEALWNDNNEFQVWDSSARTAGGWPARLGRPIQTLLMAKASQEALYEAYPTQTPFVVSRSGMPGMQRYVQTWSGDNRTEWKTLRYNLAMALNLGLSGVGNTGHDVGGFAGPRPEPELFLRWIQHGIFYPRFVIHSWKEGGLVNEPWMYPEILPQIRELFLLREKLAPYFMRLLQHAHDHMDPILRPLFYEFPDDPEATTVEDQFMLGDALLIANVFEPQAKSRRVYLPLHSAGWQEFHHGEFLAGGAWYDVPVTQDTWPMFLRGGFSL